MGLSAMPHDGAAVGFIGLGAMGSAMAHRLADAGLQLHVVEPRQEAAQPLVARSAVVHASPAHLGDAVELAFACLPSASASELVALGPEGIVRGGRIRTYIETSTIGRHAIQPIAEGLAAAGIALVDAPVSGGPKGAAEGSLALMVAGPAAAIDAARPYLDVLAGTIVVMGEAPGLAQTMKLVNNLVSAANMAAAFEGLVFGAKAGLDPDLMVEVLNASSGRNSATEDKVPRSVLPRTFDYGARLDIMYKDVTLGLAEAEAAGVPMWALGGVVQLWRFAMLQGGGGQDFTTLIQHVERWAGVEVRGRAATEVRSRAAAGGGPG